MSAEEWNTFQLRQKWIELGLHSIKQINRLLEAQDETLSGCEIHD